MFRRPLFHIRLLPHFVFYLRVYFNCLFLVGTYQFMGDYNLYTLHPSLYITATLLPPTSALPYKAIGYKTFLSYSSVFRLLQVFPFTLSSSPIFFLSALYFRTRR